LHLTNKREHTPAHYYPDYRDYRANPAMSIRGWRRRVGAGVMICCVAMMAGTARAQSSDDLDALNQQGHPALLEPPVSVKQRIPPNQGPVVGMPREPEKVAGAKQLVGFPGHCRWCRQISNSLQQRSLHPTNVATPIAAAAAAVPAHIAVQDWKLSLQTRRVPALQAPGDAACLLGCTGLAEKGE
jgi:hypothetical protein